MKRAIGYSIGYSILSCGLLSSATLFAMPAHAQFIGIPVSNGSFTLQGTPNGAQYSGPMTLLSPAGTINIISAPLPIPDRTSSITTNTPIAAYFDGVRGTAVLNDGRTANFSGTTSATQGYLKLETLATASNGNSPYLPPNNVSVTYNVRSGSLVVPEATVTGYPSTVPQQVIPITGGSFSIDATTSPQVDTVIVNSVLSPFGTTNLTLTFPDFSAGLNLPDFQVTETARNVLIHGLANGSVTLNDGTGRVAAVSDRIVTLTGTALRTNGSNFYYGEQLPATQTTIQVTITGGSISVPQSVVAVPTPPTPPTLPTPPTDSIPPAPPTESVQPPAPNPDATTIAPPNSGSEVTVASRPAPPVAPPIQTRPSFSFASNVNIGDQSDDLLRQLTQASNPQDIPEEDKSPLDISRIHGGLTAR